MLLEASSCLQSGATTVPGTLRYVARVCWLYKRGKMGAWLGASGIMSTSPVW